MANNTESVGRIEVGTKFLTMVHQLLQRPVLTSVCLFSTLLMEDISRGKGSLYKSYLQHFHTFPSAANLCLSFRNQVFNNIYMEDGLYQEAVDRLLASQGRWPVLADMN